MCHRGPSILVVDDFYPDPDAMRRTALEQEYQASSYHKGRRSVRRFLTDEVKVQFEDLLGRRIRRWEEHGYNGTFQYCTSRDPLVIHSDLQSHAAVVYLTPDAPPQAGTSFFRSRATRLRAAPTEQDARRLGLPLSALEHVMYENTLFDVTRWEEVDRLGNVYNRLVLWDARLVHAASCYFGTRPEDARLFQMFFFDVES